MAVQQRWQRRFWQAIMQKLDLAKVTAEQKAKWDDHAETYAEFILSNDPRDHASEQVLEAFTRHGQLPAGK